MFICECNVVKWSHSVAPHVTHSAGGDSNDCVLRTQLTPVTVSTTCGVIIHVVLLSTLHFYYTQTN